MNIVIASFLCLSIVFNLYMLSAQILQHQKQAGAFQLHNLGDQFKEIAPLFSKIPKVGYYTDKNTELPLVIAQFEQAQYHLAPTVLDLNHTNYPLVIFDCTLPAIALTKIQELGMQPIKANKFGIILATNPRFSELKP